MKMRVALSGSLGCMILLAGCGAGDPTGVQTGILHVSTGGTGDVLLTQSQERIPFANSVTVAVRGANDAADQFTIYTFFGLQELTFGEVPSAALVTFVSGLDPQTSSTTFMPSNVVAMALHTGFNRSLTTEVDGQSRPLAQDAPVIFARTNNGSFVLEPQISTDGSFVPQNSSSRQARYATLTLLQDSGGAQAVVDGAVAYQLSVGITQEFFGYVGNLGLTGAPSQTGGGPPPPPGSNGTGTGSGGGGSGGGGSTDGPPSPPL